ncbi:hypothetical protein [Tenacibaculum sp. 190524A02b]|uniref:Beta-carotene 15,15'-monooxygenase n=1 Tax=Tenacibaculum vairaonense TaxID=3137860 RepID=A0ABP1FKS1_9FLAO
MSIITNITRYKLAYTVTSVTFLLLVLLAFSNYAKNHPILYTGLIYDLLITVPILFYFLSKRKASRLILGIIVAVGMVTASMIIPNTEKEHLNMIRYIVLPMVEIVTLISILYYTIKTIKETKKLNKTKSIDHLQLFEFSAVKALKKEFAGKIFGGELAMLYYALFTWKSKKLANNEFSYHKLSGSIGLVGAIILVLVVETFVVHVWLVKWSLVVTWILTGLSAYSILMLLGHAKAIIKRPHLLNQNTLVLKQGLIGTCSIPLDNLKNIIFTSNLSEKETANAYYLTPLGEMESFNTVVYLQKPQEVNFMYGFKRSYTILLLSIDNKKAFQQLITKYSKMTS